jgi:uncharacterized protein (DUF1778 family)
VSHGERAPVSLALSPSFCRTSRSARRTTGFSVPRELSTRPRCPLPSDGVLMQPESSETARPVGVSLQTEAKLGLFSDPPHHTMAPMAADKFVSFRVDLEMKKLLQSLADREGITESRFLRRLLEPVLNSNTLVEPPAAPREIITRDKRLAIRLQAEDRKLLSERAQVRGVHSATYVALLVRSHLRAHPPLPTAEYLILKQSVAELRAVGRNLNQIARLMNQGGVLSPSALTGELAAVKKLAPDLRDRVLALVEANERSWLAGDGKLGTGNAAAAARLNLGLGDKRKH